MLAVPFLQQVTNAATVSDNFNRANGGLGSNWTTVAGTTAPKIANNTVQPRTAGGQWIGPAVRVQNGGQNEYLGLYFWNKGNPELMLFKRSSGTWAQLGSPYYGGALPAGTTLELSVTGPTLTFMQDGVPRITASDGSLTGGAPGIMAYGTGQVDNWSGGNLAAGPSYTVGGTVSGLNGTLLLQDNASDTLTVSANGSFTFGTPVPAGSVYSVMVKSGPSGQTCSV